MNKTNNLIIIVFVILHIFSGSLIFAKEYGKHIIVLVDQTTYNPNYGISYSSGNVNNQGMMDAYQWLYDCLLGKKSLDGLSLKLDPSIDELSVFAFGLPRESYRNIHGIGDANRQFELFANSFIEKVGTYSGYKYLYKNGGVHDFITTIMKNAFQSNTQIGWQWWKESASGVTLSHFAYPLILSRLNTTIPTSEYYLIVVSDFQSGASGEGDIKDERILSGLLMKNYQTIRSKIEKIGDPFVRVKILDKRFEGNRNNSHKEIRLLGNKILTKKAVFNPSVIITGGVSPVVQKHHNGNTFYVKPAKILFNKDESIVVDSIRVSVFDNDKHGMRLYSSLMARNHRTVEKLFDSLSRTYAIDGFQFDMGQAEPKDLKIEYSFYTTSSLLPSSSGKKNSFKSSIPFVFTAIHTIDRNQNFIVKETSGLMKTIIAAVVLLSLLTLVVQIIRVIRGKNREVDLSYKVGRVSHMRHMNVRKNPENGKLSVVNLDCLYLDNQTNQARIHVSGSARLKQKYFCINHIIKVYYEVMDLDYDDSFTFRPAGQEANGINRSNGKLYEIELHDNGSFGFDVIVDVTNIPMDLADSDHILKLGIYLKVSLIANSGATIKEFLREENTRNNPYVFIVKPKIENPDLWVAFDPGTNGSCLAYGRGGTMDELDRSVFLSGVQEKTQNGSHFNPIVPSCIVVNENPDNVERVASEPEKAVPEKDYDIGIRAYQQDNATNRFQSIKKLLGYKNELSLYANDNTKTTIKGRDLAFLLVKGILRNFESYLNTNDQARGWFMPNGYLQPSRAIVAVPNNYTVVKIYEMIESVRRLGLFKEVHYLYEAEGVMMTYLAKNLGDLPQKGNHVFVVFDMGGATINATVFGISVELDEGHIVRLDVDTLRKVGYAVGGDDIDYSLVMSLYSNPVIKGAIESTGQSPEQHMKDNKDKLLKYVQEKKMEIIASSMGKPTSLKTNMGMIDYMNIWTEVSRLFQEMGIYIPMPKQENDGSVDSNYKELADRLVNPTDNEIVKEYVYEKVSDAVNELLKGGDFSDKKVELLFSGRSTLFPGIQSTVIKETTDLCGGSHHAPIVWNGLYRDGQLDDEEVKTAVARGACWYAMWSDIVYLNHNKNTSTIGFIDMAVRPGQSAATSKFHPVIEKDKEQFDLNGHIKKMVKVWAPNLRNVRFIQMMGQDVDKIYADDLRYKMFPMLEVTAATITGTLQQVEITIDDNNNFHYRLILDGQPDIEGDCVMTDTDIVDENNESYVFAALNASRKKQINNKKHISPQKINYISHG